MNKIMNKIEMNKIKPKLLLTKNPVMTENIFTY